MSQKTRSWVEETKQQVREELNQADAELETKMV